MGVKVDNFIPLPPANGSIEHFFSQSSRGSKTSDEGKEKEKERTNEKEESEKEKEMNEQEEKETKKEVGTKRKGMDTPPSKKKGQTKRVEKKQKNTLLSYFTLSKGNKKDG